MPEVLTVGETMLSLTPLEGPLVGAAALRTGVAGAESNVAAHLVDLDVTVAWASRLGDDPHGQSILRELSARGVDVAGVAIDPARPTGVMFKDPGAEGSKVHYLRKGSAASAIAPGFVTDSMLAGAVFVHVSGVTPALSDSCEASVDELFARARRCGVRVSFDVNHRPALWSDGRAAEILLGFARNADLCFVGRDEAEAVWSTSTADDVRGLLPDVPILIVKDGAIGATAYTADRTVFVPAPRVDVVEPVGAGDAFAAGVLAGLVRGASLDEALALGHARAGLTLISPNDLPVRETVR